MSFDPHTGTRRITVGSFPEGGVHGDYTAGDHYVSALYVSDDGHGCAEIDVYVEHAGRDIEDFEDDGYPFAVVEMATIGEAVYEDGNVRPDDSADISYEYPFPVDFRTLDEAQAAADRHGNIDQSYALYLRKREETAA